MKKLILASNNQKKIKELKEILKGFNVEVKSLKEEGIDIDVVEDGATFEENAKKKAKEIHEFLSKRGDKDYIVLADDSGLMVDYLNGEPGVYSARYAGEHGNDAKNNEKLLNNLKNVKKSERGAKFACSIAVFDEDGKYYNTYGEVKGVILEELQGKDGFGYDPLFLYEPFGKTFAELSGQEKNEISHRGIALKKLKEVIEKLI